MKVILLLTFHFILIINDLVNVIHSSSNLTVISQNNYISKDNNKKRKLICQSQSLFTNYEQQVYLVQAKKPFKVNAFTKNKHLIVTGVSKSIYNQLNASYSYESQIVVKAKCDAQNQVVNYQLYLNIQMNSQSLVLGPIPIKLMCYSYNNINKFQYVLLQFIMSVIFLCSNIIFSYVNSSIYRCIDSAIIIILILSVFHKVFSLMFNLFCFMRVFHACFARMNVAPNRIQKMIVIQGILAITLMFIIKSVEHQLLWIHYVGNFVTILGIGIILKITRLRYLVTLWLLLYFFYDSFTYLTENHEDLQFYFPALSLAKSYTCVSINILELALPLVFSIFFLRFSERFSYNKKIYLMFNFMSYIIINIFASIIILKDNKYRSVTMANINSIIFLGILLAILENNFDKLSTFKLN